MYSKHSPSTENVKQNINKYLERAKSEILSNIDYGGNQMKSYSGHSPRREKKIDSTYYMSYQYPMAVTGKDYSNSKHSRIKNKYHYDDLLFDSSDNKGYANNENSLVNARTQENTPVTESNYKGGSSRRSSSVGLDTSQGVMSLAKNYKLECPDSQSTVKNLKEELDKVPKSIFWDVVQTLRPYLTDEQITTLGINTHPDDKRSVLNVSQATRAAGESHPGVWHRGRKGFVPPDTEPVVTTRSGFPLYAGRVRYQGNLIPATVSPHKGLAYFSWNGKIFCSGDFEILEIHHFAWVDEGSARENLYKWPVGRTSEGKPLYLGRVYLEGMGPWVGRVHRDRDRGHICIAFRGNELLIPQPYEVLVMY